MNWSDIFNYLGSALGVAVATFGSSMAVPGTKPESAGVAAGIAFIGALFQHARTPPGQTG